MEYIIMADGSGKRWNSQEIKSKCNICIDGESLLQRTTRLIRKYDTEPKITITTHDSSICVKGAETWQPKNNCYEIDRFTIELLKPGVCYLYGDTYYSEESIKKIVDTPVEKILFFGNFKKIFAVKIMDDKLFYHHFQHVRELYMNKEINEAIGWEIYHDFVGAPLESREIYDSFSIIDDVTQDFNTIDDYKRFLDKMQ